MSTVLAVCLVVNLVIGVVNLWNLFRIRRLEAELVRRLDGRGV